MKRIQNPQEQRIRLTSEEKLVIDQLLWHSNNTRIGLSKALGVSPAWITKTIKPLFARHLIEETGEAEKSGGRRAKTLGISREVGGILGLDLGVDALKLGVVDLNAREVQFRNVSLERLQIIGQGPTIKDTLKDFINSAGFMLEEIRAIGIGLSGEEGFLAHTPASILVHSQSKVSSFINLICDLFPKALILADRDASLMALGEQAFGLGREMSSYIFLKLGDTISAGIVCQGHVYRGVSGCAGEIGHMVIDENGPKCSCGKAGCLVALTGGQAIASQAMQMAETGSSLLLSARLKQTNSGLSAEDVGDAASQGDLAAIEMIDQYGESIGQALSGLVQFFNPESVFIGGGVSRIGHRLIKSIHQVVLREASPLATRDLKIDYSQLADRACILGAIKLIQGEVFVEKPG